MSGDVQPRKRKEKRRKRADHEYYIQRIQCLEDEDAGTPPPTLIGPSDHGDNVTIHIHKEGGTGGHWCAKIIFFVLLSVLVGLVGVIILESRGSTDVDTPVASSRWAMIFEGWVDDSLSLHDDHEESHDKGDHEAASHEEDEEHQEEQDDHGDDEEAEQADSEEEISNEGENEEEQEDEDSETGPPGVGEDNYYDDDEREEENDSGTLEEVDDDEAEREIEEDENEDEEDDEAEAELLDVSIEGVSTTAAVNKDDDEEDEENNDVSYEFVGIPGVNDIDDDSDEPLEEIEDDPEIDEMTEDSVDLGEDNEDEVEEEPSSVAVKFGVGVALVVAAHFVLVRRWSNADGELAGYNGEGPPDLSRRDTLISSIPLIPKEVRTETMQQERKNDSSNVSKNSPKDPEPQISSIPARVEVEVDTSESELHSGTEEDGNCDEDTEDEEQEEEDDIVEIDDTELVAKLEAKYGKIPTPSQSENEDDEELDDDDEEEEEEEDLSEEEDEEEQETDKQYDWKHVKAPKAHSGSQPAIKETRSSGPRGDQGKSTAGPQDITFDNASDFDELMIQEELENWLMRDFDN